MPGLSPAQNITARAGRVQKHDVRFEVSLLTFFSEKAVGVANDEGPPVPIPNTVVKLIRAHDTWLVTARENR